LQGVIVACDAALAAMPGHEPALQLRAAANMRLEWFKVRGARQS